MLLLLSACAFQTWTANDSLELDPVSLAPGEVWEVEVEAVMDYEAARYYSPVGEILAYVELLGDEGLVKADLDVDGGLPEQVELQAGAATLEVAERVWDGCHMYEVCTRSCILELEATGHVEASVLLMAAIDMEARREPQGAEVTLTLVRDWMLSE